jgi:hypothetical protein
MVSTFKSMYLIMNCSMLVRSIILFMIYALFWIRNLILVVGFLIVIQTRLLWSVGNERLVLLRGQSSITFLWIVCGDRMKGCLCLMNLLGRNQFFSKWIYLFIIEMNLAAAYSRNSANWWGQAKFLFPSTWNGCSRIFSLLNQIRVTLKSINPIS